MFLFKEFFKPKSSQHVVFFLASFSCTNWGSNIAWGVKLGVLAGMWQGSSSGYLGWPSDDPENGGLMESEDDSFTGKPHDIGEDMILDTWSKYDASK